MDANEFKISGFCCCCFSLMGHLTDLGIDWMKFWVGKPVFCLGAGGSLACGNCLQSRALPCLSLRILAFDNSMWVILQPEVQWALFKGSVSISRC